MMSRFMSVCGVLGVLGWGASWTTAGGYSPPTPLQVLARGGFGDTPRFGLAHATSALWQLDDRSPPLFGVFLHEATRPEDTTQLRAFDLWVDVPRISLDPAVLRRLVLAARLLGRHCFGQDIPPQLERLVSSLPLWASGQEYRWRGGWSLLAMETAQVGWVRITVQAHLPSEDRPACRMSTRIRR